MEKEERDILVCMSEELLNPVQIAETVAMFTEMPYQPKFLVATYLWLWRMEAAGLVEFHNSGQPKILPKLRLTAQGLLEKSKVLAENPSIKSAVFRAGAKIESILINSLASA